MIDEENDPNPVVTFYPVCSTCGVAWVYRRCLSFATGGYRWLWQRDCKHKSEPRIESVEP